MKNRSLLNSFNYAVNGIIHTIKSERNMKIHISLSFAIIVLSLFYKLSRIEFLLVCLTIAAVLVCELFNTAVEVMVDIIVDVYHPKAKIVKDVAAGGVLISAFAAVIVGYTIFFDRISGSLQNGLNIAKHSPVHLTVISLIITIITVVILKAVYRKGTPFHGGMPSGHSAVSFSITTAIALWTENMPVTIFCLVISLLVIQSRLEGKIHNIMELSAGAVVGFLVTLLLFQVFYR